MNNGRMNNGAWLSLVERSVRDREVVGSNPIAPTLKNNGLEAVNSTAFLLIPALPVISPIFPSLSDIFSLPCIVCIACIAWPVGRLQPPSARDIDEARRRFEAEREEMKRR
jgi:hypothetical protein